MQHLNRIGFFIFWGARRIRAASGGTVATLIGTSGFSFDDWKGVFYPADLPREDYIRYYSMFFPFVELDFSYFKMPDGWRLDQLASATPKDFIFTIKAHRSLTHEPPPDWMRAATEFKKALRVRSFKDRLAGVLLQFPHKFQYIDPNRLYLGELTKELSEFPLFLEFQNGEWLRTSVLTEAAKRGIGIVSVDSPDLPIPQGRDLPITGESSYVRFLGRNAASWWSGKGDERYDYSYSDTELSEWVRIISSAEKKSISLFAAFNNHPNCNAVHDARRLKALIDAERPRLETLAKTP